VLQFGLRKPAHRVLVNTVAALGAVGFTTHLFPSMTLGCGSWGNNITSDNVGPQHLLNVKRLAYETREYIPDVQAGTAAPASAWPRGDAPGADAPSPANETLESRIAGFLTKRGLLPRGADAPPSAGLQSVVGVRETGAAVSRSGAPEPPRGRAAPPARTATTPTPTPAAPPAAAPTPEPVEFVAEDDVREAVEKGEKIRIGPDTIITPSARELGEERGVFRRH